MNPREHAIKISLSGVRNYYNFFVTFFFVVFTAVEIEVEFLWVVTPCGVVECRRFGGPCCKARHQAVFSEMSVSCCRTARRHIPEELDLYQKHVNIHK
jgi:hypothetical protein